MIPGELLVADGDIELAVGRATRTLVVSNTGDRPIQVGSHYHFAETNAALAFDRDQRVGHQQRQRLPQRAGAHAVVVLEVLDAQALARLQIAAHDVVTQRPVGAFGERAGFGFVAARRRAGSVDGLEQCVQHERAQSGSGFWARLSR